MGNLLRPIPFFLLMIALCSYAAGEDKRVVCYYTNWSVYRPGTAKFSPQNINPYLCTHLIYAFGGLDKDNGLRPYDKYQDIEQGGYAKFTGLKTYNKNLKTMLAIGGWNEGSARFSPLVADEERRREFVKNVVKFLRQNHFDGLDLDWEYPAFRDGGKPRDRDNYAQLVQELREEFEKESSKTGRTRLLLTMAVPAGIEYIDKGYDIPKLNRYLDFMNILSYDYHSAFEPAVNHHSPLYSLQEDDEYNFDAELSIDYTIKHYLKLGADRDKLVLGIPTYGRSYTLFNPDSTALGSPADGPGEQGEATREKGYLAYYEICQSLNSEKDWKIEQPKLGAMGPYAYKDKQWVGYDDAFIVKEKAKYVNDKNLGGIMFWSIDNDDFRGKCHDRPYPLIEAGKEMLFGTSGKKSSSKNNIASSSQTETKTARPLRRPGQKSSKPKTASLRTTTAATTTRQTTTGNPLTTPEPPTTPDPGSDFVCKDEGFFPHPRDCKKYFWCLDSGPSNLGIVAHQFTCPSGLFFNKAADSCDFARNVLCKDKRDKAATSTAKPTTSSSTTQQTTTSSSRLKFTAATAKSTGNRYTTTTTTTTEPPPEEDDEDEVEDDYHAEEDPQTIKQLITLIKKLGGVAELEKQLENNGGSDVTNSPISKTLYNKVLTPGKFQSPYRNGPSGPQNEGLPPPAPGQDDSPYSRREKPQYVTIRRERPSTDQPVSEEGNSRGGSEREEADDEQEDRVEVEAERERPIKPLYSTIQRRRPSTSTEASSESTSPSTAVTKTRYSSIQRSRPSTVASDSADTTTSRYVTLQRHRPQQLDTEEEVAEDERVSPLPFVRSRPPQDDVIEPLDDEQPTTTTQKPAKKVSDEATELRPVYEHTSELSATTTSTTTTTSPSAADDDDQLTITSTTTATTTTTTDNSSPRTNTETTTTEGPVVSNDNDSSSPGNIASNDSDSSSPGEIPTISTEQTTAVPYQTSTITSVVTVIVEGATERQRVALGRLEEVLAEHNVTSSREQAKLKDSSAEINKISLESSKEIAPTLKANRTGGQLRNIPRRRLNVGKVGQDSTTEPYRPSGRRFRPSSTEPSVSNERPPQTRFIPSRTRNRTSVPQGDDNAVSGRTRSFIRRPQQQDIINNSSEGDDVRGRTRSFVRKPAPQDDISKSSEGEDVRPRSRDFRRKPDESTNNSEVPRRNPTRTRSRFSSRNNSTSESTPINDSSIEDTGSNEASKLNELTSTRPRSRFAIARNRGATSTTSTTTINPPTRHVFGRGRSRLTTVKPEVVTSEELTNSSQSVENTSRQRLTPYYVPIQRTSNNQYLIHHEATRNDSSEILIQMENTNVLTKSKNKTSNKEGSVENNSGEVLDSSSESVSVNTTDSNVLVGDESGEKVEDSIGSASGNSQEVSKSSQEVTDAPVETTTVVVDMTVTTTTEVPPVDTSESNVTNHLKETKSNSTGKFKKQRGSAKFSLTDDSEEDASKSTEVEDNTSKEVNSSERSKDTSRERARSKDSSREKILNSRERGRGNNTSRERILNSSHVDNTTKERRLNSEERGTVNNNNNNSSRGRKLVSADTSGKEELVSRSKFNVENFDRHKSSAKSRDISQSDHDDKVFLESVDDSGLRKRKKVVRLLPRNRNGTNETTSINDSNGKRIVTVVRPRNSVGRNSVGKENEFEVKTEQPSSTTVRSNSNFLRTSTRNRDGVQSRTPDDDFLKVKTDVESTTARNSLPRSRTKFNRNEVITNLDVNEEEFLRVNPDEIFTSTVRNNVQITPTRTTNRNNFRSRNSNSVGDVVSNLNTEEPVRNSFQRTSSRNRNVETSNSVGRDNELSTVTDESTVRSSFQRTQSRNRNNAEGRGSNIRGKYEKKEGTTLTPETSSRGRIRFRVEDDGSSFVNDNSFDDVYDENGFVVKKKKKPRVSEETGVRYEEDVGHNYRKVVVRNRVIHRKNTDKDSVRSRSRVNNEDLETGQSGRVSKKVDDDVRFENSLSSAGAKKSGVTRNRGSVRAKESLKDEVEGVDYDEEEGGEEGGHRERATNIENEIAVETESEKENTRIRIVPVRRVVSRNRSTTTEEPATTVRDNFTSRRYSNKFRQKEAATTTRQDPTSSQQSDSDDFAITTVRPRKFTFPKRLARPSTTLETPIAEQLQKTTERPFDSQEDNTSGSGLPDLADVGVVAIQALATVPPSNFQSVTYSTPSSLFPRRTSTVQTLIHHTIPVTSLGTGTSPQAVTAVSSSTVRSSPSLIQAVTQTHRAVPRPFSKKRPTTLAPPPKPAYITKGRTKHVDEIADYEVDYYAEPVDVPLSGKVRIHNDGYIECLDVGNFPHPFSCRKFISCAKMETEHLLGWEYTCPRGLSFDPIGGICNWSAGLGCKE